MRSGAYFNSELINKYVDMFKNYSTCLSVVLNPLEKEECSNNVHTVKCLYFTTLLEFLEKLEEMFFRYYINIYLLNSQPQCFFTK